MITGVVVTDANNDSSIKLTEAMISPLTNCFWFTRGLCHGSNVVTDVDTWAQMAPIAQIPTDVPVFIAADPFVISRKYPTTPVVVLGNEVVKKYVDVVDRLIHIRYHEIAEPTGGKPFVFPFGETRVLTNTPHYVIYDYVLKESDQLDFAATNSAFALPDRHRKSNLVF